MKKKVGQLKTMVSKNNQWQHLQASVQRVRHYGLRKLSVGVASVLLSTTLYMGVNAHADTMTTLSESSTPTTTAVTGTGSGSLAGTSTGDGAVNTQPASTTAKPTNNATTNPQSNVGQPVNKIGTNKVADSSFSDEQATRYFNTSVNKDVVKTRVGWALQSDVDSVITVKYVKL